jgi:hypothetical protein
VGEGATALYRAGWGNKMKIGRRIWCQDKDDPWSGWKSEEMAYMMTSEEENSP